MWVYVCRWSVGRSLHRAPYGDACWIVDNQTGRHRTLEACKSHAKREQNWNIVARRSVGKVNEEKWWDRFFVWSKRESAAIFYFVSRFGSLERRIAQSKWVAFSLRASQVQIVVLATSCAHSFRSNLFLPRKWLNELSVCARCAVLCDL